MIHSTYWISLINYIDTIKLHWHWKYDWETLFHSYQDSINIYQGQVMNFQKLFVTYVKYKREKATLCKEPLEFEKYKRIL